MTHEYSGEWVKGVQIIEVTLTEVNMADVNNAQVITTEFKKRHARRRKTNR